MRGENGVAVKKSSTKKTIEDVKSINKNNNKKRCEKWGRYTFNNRCTNSK